MCSYLLGSWESLLTTVQPQAFEPLRAAPSEKVGGIKFSWYLLDIKAKLDFVQPAGEESIDVPFGVEPCNRLIIRADNEVRANAVRPRRSAAEQVVAEYAQGVDHGKQLQDVGRISLLGRSELAALVGNRVVDPVVIGLSEARLDSFLAGVGRRDRAPARVEDA